MNLAHIKSLKHKDSVHELLLMDNSTRIHVSRLHLQKVKDRLNDWKNNGNRFWKR